MFEKCTLLTALFLGQAGLAEAYNVDDIAGNWRTVLHGAEVRIADCGDNTPCAFLVSVGEDIRGHEIHDVRNRRPELRSRSLQDLPIFWGYQRSKSGWKRGKLYNPETGQTFRSSLVIVSTDKLEVKGCLGPLCRAQIWKRIQKQETANTEGSSND